MNSLRILSFTVAVLFATTAFAGNQRGGNKRGHKGPPTKMVQACVDKAEGDACSFEGRNGTVEGTCSTGRYNDILRCRPGDGFRGRHGRHGRHGRMGPPTKMIDACANKAEGDVCSFEGRDGTLEGTCLKGRRNNTLMCKPKAGFRGRHHRNGPPQKMIDACADKAEGAECSFEGRNGIVEGTCFTGRRNNTRMCKPLDWDRGRHHRKGPPQELLDACADKAEGDQCSFEGRDGIVQGTCATGMMNKELMCKPGDEYADKRGRKGPPRKMFEACADKSEGDTCSFESRKGTVAGTCTPGRHGEHLVCLPEYNDSKTNAPE